MPWSPVRRQRPPCRLDHGSRGASTIPAGSTPTWSPAASTLWLASRDGATAPPATEAEPAAVEFVCEDDVRAALRESRPIVIDERTIVTPAARDLAERHGVFAGRGAGR